MKVLVALIVLIAVTTGIIALQPSEFRVERSITIAAPPAVVFAQVNDFHKWETWSPWVKLDPTAKYHFEGAPAGTGAIFTWAGNSTVGEGHMRIIESRPDDLIKIKLDFTKPFTASDTVTFTFIPVGDQTAVTWSINGRKNFIGKAFSFVMNCNKMIGNHYEKGLANLKSVSEAAAKE